MGQEFRGKVEGKVPRTTDTDNSRDASYYHGGMHISPFHVCMLPNHKYLHNPAEYANTLVLDSRACL